MSTTHKHDYTTKQQKLDFICWFIDHYGYHVNQHLYNARILHEQYLHDKLIDIPQLSIHRWITKLNSRSNSNSSNSNSSTVTHQKKNNNMTILHECLDKYVSHYVAEQFTQVSHDVLKQ